MSSDNGTTRAAKTTRVWADTVQPARCRDPKCGASITFATNVKSGKAMPFDGELVALATERDAATGRQIWTVDLSTSHFASCIAAGRFRR